MQRGRKDSQETIVHHLAVSWLPLKGYTYQADTNLSINLQELGTPPGGRW